MATILGNAALWRQFAGFAKAQHADENVRAYIEIDQFKRQFDADDADSDLPANGRLVAYARDIHAALCQAGR